MAVLNDWALAADKFFQLLDSIRPEPEQHPSNSTASDAQSTVWLLTAPPTQPPPMASTSTQAPASSSLSTLDQPLGPSSSFQIISPWNTKSAQESWTSLALKRVDSWTQEVVFDNKIKMFAKCVQQESAQHIPAVCINFELSAWMFCTLTEVRY